MSQNLCTKLYVLTDRTTSVYKTGADEYQRDRLARSAALDYLRRQPAAALALWPKKLFALYRWTGSDGIDRCRKGLDPAQTKMAAFLKSLAGAGEVVYRSLWAFFVMAVFALPVCYRGQWAVLISSSLGIVLFGGLTLVHLIFFGSGRYHFPMIPWMAMHAAAMLAMILCKTVRSETTVIHAH